MIPDAMPTISAGPHDPGDGQACLMEYVSLLAGEEWSDRPECTHPLLAHEARTVNDGLPDRDRGRLVPLVGRLLGTTEDSDTIRARLRLTQAQQVLALVEPAARGPVHAAIEVATRRLDGSGSTSDVDDALARARALTPTEGHLDPDHAAHHRQATRIVAFALSPELGPAEAWALLALATAHAVAAGECRADCGDPVARARRGVKELTALVDTYDAATGRVARPTTPEQVRRLADALV
ncbi:MAG: hypothetical protein PGN07_07295 [Aeromicrobium erythreum]